MGTETADPSELETALQLAREVSLRAGIRALEELVAKRPDHAEAWAHLGYIAELDQDLPKAVGCYLRLLELRPDDAHLRLRLADCYDQMGDASKAAETLSRIDSDRIAEDDHLRARLATLGGSGLRGLGEAVRRIRSIPRRLFDPRFLPALWREITSFGPTLRTLREPRHGRYLAYLEELFLDSWDYRLPIEPCDLCGSCDQVPTFFYRFQKNVLCPHCGLEYVQRRPRESLDVETGWYNWESSIELMEKRWHNEAALRDRLGFLDQVFREAGESFPRLGGEVFEVGCGEGHVLKSLQDRGMRVRGIETAAKLVDRCRNDFGLEVTESTLDRIDFPAESFDYVLAYHVLEHLSHPKTFFQKAFHLLKPGGFVVVEVPSPALHQATLTDKLDPFHGYANLGHMHYFTVETMSSCFRKYGFELRNTYHYSSETLPSSGFLGQKPFST